MMTRAVLFLTFNRLDSTKLVFEQIRLARPPRLYLSSDGARSTKEGEEQIVDAVRKYVLDNIDWECEVKVRFNERNLGCGKSVAGAITWFFENEKDGIILEDDCLPDPSFFGYCEQMLDYYKDDKRVWSILGDNPLGYSNIKYPYYFSRYPHPWGWASWADRWSYYEFDMTDYDQSLIDHYSKNKYVREDLSEVLRAMKNHEIDTWDYQWLLTANKYNALSVIPRGNLISNLGVCGVHYDNAEDDPRLNAKTYAYDLQAVVHRPNVTCNERLSLMFYKKFILPSYTSKEILRYMYIHPLFLFKKTFWHML